MLGLLDPRAVRRQLTNVRVGEDGDIVVYPGVVRLQDWKPYLPKDYIDWLGTTGGATATEHPMELVFSAISCAKCVSQISLRVSAI